MERKVKAISVERSVEMERKAKAISVEPSVEMERKVEAFFFFIESCVK